MAAEQHVEGLTEASSSAPPCAFAVSRRMHNSYSPRADEEEDLVREFGCKLSRIDIAKHRENWASRAQRIEQRWIDEVSTMHERFAGAETVDYFSRYWHWPAEVVGIAEHAEAKWPVVGKLERDATLIRL